MLEEVNESWCKATNEGFRTGNSIHRESLNDWDKKPLRDTSSESQKLSRFLSTVSDTGHIAKKTPRHGFKFQDVLK